MDNSRAILEHRNEQIDILAHECLERVLSGVFDADWVIRIGKRYEAIQHKAHVDMLQEVEK